MMRENDREMREVGDTPGRYVLVNVRKPRPGTKPGTKSDVSQRLMSLDAYRGLVMVFLASTGFGIAAMARKFIAAARDGVDIGGLAVEPEFWETVVYHFSHPEWISQTGTVGATLSGSLGVFCCSAWDMIQASFMFMVGVSMVYSYSKRATRGDSRGGTLIHVAARSVVLVLLGVFLSSFDGTQTNWTFTNVLSQIGLGYSFVYLLLNRRLAVQVLGGAVILIGSWLAFFLYPAAGPDFDYGSRGVGQEKSLDHVGPAALAAEWKMPEEPNPWCRSVDYSPWTKNVNLATDADRWFLNLFPRSEPFEYNRGGYTTLNFVPSIFTMLLGAMAGQLLRGPRRPISKFGWLVLGGAICLLLGAGAGLTVCPVVKRIWTPSWALLAGGWSLWSLAAFYFVIDVLKIRFWTWPLVVVGMNSILVYVMFQTIRHWTGRMLDIHLGKDFLSAWMESAGRMVEIQVEAERLPGWIMYVLPPDTHLQFSQAGPYGPVVAATMMMAVFWLICVWLYRNKHFIRI